MSGANIDTQLRTYRAKRHFGETPEPDDIAEKRKSKPGKRTFTGNLFVVQKHAASRLHYDFRLELNGVLKSWAIPKGPSLDPSVKRMAAQVEDHPLSYAAFEGAIPAGHYGAGTVIVWDTGTWHSEDDNIEAAYAKGHLRFELRGKKLHGKWHLVRMRGSNDKNSDKAAWLLIKQRDDAAKPAAQYDILEAQPDSVLQGTIGKRWGRSASGAKNSPKKQERPRKKSDGPNVADLGKRAALPLMLAPELATLVDTEPRDSGWIYEVKLDGYRVLTRIDAREGVRLFTRNGNDWTHKLKTLAHALERLNLDEGWLDGEIVVLDSNGISNFQRLQNAFEEDRTTPLVYMLFDIPYYGGRDLRAVPLEQRRALLRELLQGNKSSLIRFSEAIDTQNSDLLQTACDMRVEGLIGKRSNSVYTSGRTRDWIKLKCKQRQEFVIGGYTDSSNNSSFQKNVRAIGALLLGVHDASGQLRYVGKVGTGFTQTSATELFEKLQPLVVGKQPFANDSGQRNAHWVKPKLLAEVEFAAWTDDGHIRHSAFQGLRTDKPAKSIGRETPVHIDHSTTNKTMRKSGETTKAKTKPRAEKSKGDHAAVAGVSISHPDRIVDKTSGLTKLDVVRFYELIAPQLLPHLKDRPVSLVRAPEGVGGEVFFQKHQSGMHIPQLTELPIALMPNHPPLIAIDSLTALIQCVQMNVFEFHTWNAKLAHSEQPDRMVFDLDPGEGITWKQVVEAAQLMKAMLDELQLKSFLKTSGGKGLHVVVPLAPREGWQDVRDFSEQLARHMAATLPQLFVATSGPKNRIGRIFIDYLRNNRGSTTASAFSARLRPGLGVSAPMRWEELNDIESSAQWHVGNVDKDVAREREKAWSGYGRVRQTLTRARKRLAAPD